MFFKLESSIFIFKCDIIEEFSLYTRSEIWIRNHDPIPLFADELKGGSGILALKQL